MNASVMIQWLAVASLACSFTRNLQAQSEEKPGKVKLLTTADGVRFGIWPKRPAHPAPTLFVFAGSIEDALLSSYFRQAGQFMLDDGIVFVSIDLPCHGKDVRLQEGAGLSGWRVRINKGEDVMADVAGKLKCVLDHLIQDGITDPARIGALGTSRGGFVAAHFAAADERVKSVMGFAPVTDLAALSEFRGAEDLPMVKKLSLANQADALAGRDVWVVIGDRDARVSTDAAIAFARAVTNASLKKNAPALAELHVIPEPKGHTVPAGYAKIGAAWLRERLLAKSVKP